MNMSTMDHFILILLSMLVAFGPRFIPLRIFSTREIPKWFNEWMKYVPVSLFTALVVKDVFMDTKTYTFVGCDYMALPIAHVQWAFPLCWALSPLHCWQWHFQSERLIWLGLSRLFC